MANDSTTGPAPIEPTRHCSKGHARNANHAVTVLLNMPTTSADYADAAAAGYCTERRWSCNERRRG
jgi:hypothetical protein